MFSKTGCKFRGILGQPQGVKLTLFTVVKPRNTGAGLGDHLLSGRTGGGLLAEPRSAVAVKPEPGCSPSAWSDAPVCRRSRGAGALRPAPVVWGASPSQRQVPGLAPSASPEPAGVGASASPLLLEIRRGPGTLLVAVSQIASASERADAVERRVPVGDAFAQKNLLFHAWKEVAGISCWDTHRDNRL